jgi:protease I
MSGKILIVTGDAGESYETLYALHRFREAGFTPVIAAPSKRALHLVIHDFEPGWDTYVERPGYAVSSDLTFDDVQVDDYIAVNILGGRAPEYLRHTPKVLDLVREFQAKGKWIFAICHGIQVLISAGLAAGTCMTAYEHVRFEVEAAGATYSTSQAVRYGKMVTAQNWGSHPEFYREIFACLQEDQS